jgi:hypothetical protein
MSAFADKLMVRYMTPANVDLLLAPAADTTKERLKFLLRSVYDMRYQTIREVGTATVLRQEFQLPLAEPVEIRGSMERLVANAEQTMARFSIPALGKTTWIAMELDVAVEVKVEIAFADLEGIDTEDLSDVATIAQLQSKFLFLDVPSLMGAAGVTTLQELKRELPQLVKLRYADPPIYNTNDPNARRQFRLGVCALFVPSLDLEGAIRDAKMCRRVSELARPHRLEFEGGEVRAGCAWMVVFPTASVTTGTPTVTEIEGLFAADSIVAAFETV